MQFTLQVKEKIASDFKIIFLKLTVLPAKGSSKEWQQHNEMRRKGEIELMLQQGRLREIPSFFQCQKSVLKKIWTKIKIIRKKIQNML